MNQTLKDLVTYYQKQGAPGDQNALIGLLRDIQQENGGAIPGWTLTAVAEAFGVKESFLQAIVRRIPSLRLADTHCLELCAGPNCGKSKALADCARALHAASNGAFELKLTPCMRMCGKGPNLRWDGVLHHQATEALLRQLTAGASKKD